MDKKTRSVRAKDVPRKVGDKERKKIDIPILIDVLSRLLPNAKFLGHSERRKYFGESDAGVNRKIQAALAQGLVPIVCVGETLDEYEAGKTAQVVGSQIRQGFVGLNTSLDVSNADSLVVAYEPVWAIGTGKPSTPTGAAAVVVEVIRPVLAALFGDGFSSSVRVLYGGSVTGENAAEFFKEPEIDGALVGGASLKVAEFVKIVQSAYE